MKRTHISLHMDSELARAARIQAITDGMSLKAWVSQAIIRQLAAEETTVGDNKQVGLVEQETQAGKDGVGREYDERGYA
jgi:hypothetical protein